MASREHSHIQDVKWRAAKSLKKSLNQGFVKIEPIDLARLLNHIDGLEKIRRLILTEGIKTFKT